MSDTDDDGLHAKQIPSASKCEMANCRSNLDPNTKKSYFRFPKNDYFCSQWAFACARPDLVDLYLDKCSMFLYKTRKLCEEHFIKEDFRNPALLSQGLIKGIVPTKNLPEFKTIVRTINENKSKTRNEDSIQPTCKDCPEINRNKKKFKKTQII